MKNTTFAIASLLYVTGSLHAATIVFKEGANVVSSDGAINIATYTGTEDTSVVQESPNNNYGGRTTILVGVLGAGKVRAGHVRFDVTSLASQFVTIDSIKFRFYVETTGGTSQSISYGAHKAVSGDWVEGTANGAGQTGSATYNYQIHSTLGWASTGGRGSSDAWPDQLLPVSSGGYGAAGTWIEMTLDPSGYDPSLDTPTELIQSWITDGAQNDGILMTYSNNVSNPQWQLASSEHATAAWRPELVIEYTAIPEPSSAALLGLGGLALIFRRRK
ncbi:MAG: DNRLRE domain-containing protein [Akkermansiaceae bacterium]|nr:DNRLRE domain-containing protein [Akkermansiaceae bacterium]